MFRWRLMVMGGKKKKPYQKIVSRIIWNVWIDIIGNSLLQIWPLEFEILQSLTGKFQPTHSQLLLLVRSSEFSTDNLTIQLTYKLPRKDSPWNHAETRRREHLKLITSLYEQFTIPFIFTGFGGYFSDFNSQKIYFKN